MSDLEKHLIKALLHSLVDSGLPGALKALEAILPSPTNLVIDAVSAVSPQLIKILDKAIDEI